MTVLHDQGVVQAEYALVKVRRDGNPHRRFGHVCLLSGKLGWVQPENLRLVAHSLAQSLPSMAPPVLLVGLAESSLLLASFVRQALNVQSTLCLSSREHGRDGSSIQFLECHSHAPRHYIDVPGETRFGTVVIVEDEVTTGNTARNLIVLSLIHI